MDTRRTKALLARDELRHEIKRTGEEIKFLDKEYFHGFTHEAAQLRKKLQARATVLSMAVALANCRMHARIITIDGKTRSFKRLEHQADFLAFVINSPYCILTSRQAKLVYDVINDYDFHEFTAEMRYSDRIENRRQTRRKGREIVEDESVMISPVDMIEIAQVVGKLNERN